MAKPLNMCVVEVGAARSRSCKKIAGPLMTFILCSSNTSSSTWMVVLVLLLPLRIKYCMMLSLTKVPMTSASPVVQKGQYFEILISSYLWGAKSQVPLAFTLVPVSSTPNEEIDISLYVLSKDVHLPACAVRTFLVSQLRMLSSMEVELGSMLGVAFILTNLHFLELMCDAQNLSNWSHPRHEVYTELGIKVRTYKKQFPHHTFFFTFAHLSY